MCFNAPFGDKRKMKHWIENGLKPSSMTGRVGFIDRTHDFGKDHLWHEHPKLALKMQQWIDTGLKSHLEK